MFSKACEYGIKAAVFIASRSLEEKRTSLKEIAKEIDSPIAFTAKILQQLAKKGILESSTGPNGGFRILKTNIERIILSDIVNAIDGDSIYEACALGSQGCMAEMPCPLHDRFVDIREKLKQMLTTTTLSGLATGLQLGMFYLRDTKIPS